MSEGIQGSLNGEGLRIGIAVARFNSTITSKLLAGARSALTQHGVVESDLSVASVPGSFELPVTAKKMAESGRFDAIVCIGAVIKGETDHYHHVSEAASQGVMRVGLYTGIPVVFGVLTTDTIEQAVARTGGDGEEYLEKPRPLSKIGLNPGPTDGIQGNEGYNAGLTAIEMANLMSDLD